MRIIKLSATIFAIGLFLTACGSDQTQTTTNAALSGEYWAKDNLDLQRVGDLLERSDSPQEFEAYLNEDDGIDNLDLNGDGYVDYISVDEFEDRGDYERGLSLYCRFGPDAIQEVATIVFYRDDFNSPGARILITGNEQIYGDNYYYETNWVDRTIELVSFLFGPRDVYYHSPYYYDYYPPDYVVYDVIDTPVYRTRIERLYPQPAFVYTTAPTFITKIKIKSPNNGLHLGQIRARLVKPTKEQAEFLKKNPGRPQFVKADRPDKVDKGDKGGDKPARPDDAPKPDMQPKEVRKAEPERANPSKPPKAERPNVNPPKPARVEQPTMNPSKPAKPGNDGAKGGGKGKKP